MRLLADPRLAPYPILVYLIAGAMGETVGSVVRAPAENIKASLRYPEGWGLRVTLIVDGLADIQL